MGEELGRDLAVAAAVGCASGFFWSAVAGRADVSTPQGFLQASYGCLGSAATASSVRAVSEYVTDNRDFARKATAGWFGIQFAAGTVNSIGSRFHLQDNTTFNAVSFSVNFAAAPISSVAGLALAATGDFENGASGSVSFFGGSLVFHHKSCLLNKKSIQGFQYGAVTHYCAPLPPLELKFHENCHMVQNSIMGDVGAPLMYFLNGGFLTPWTDKLDGVLVAESWADSCADKSMRHYVRSEEFFDRRQDIFEKHIAEQERRLQEKWEFSTTDQALNEAMARHSYIDLQRKALYIPAGVELDILRDPSTLGNNAGLSAFQLRQDNDLVAALRLYLKSERHPRPGKLFASQEYFDAYSNFLEEIIQDADGNISPSKYHEYLAQLRKNGEAAGRTATQVEEDARKLSHYAYAFYLNAGDHLLSEFIGNGDENVEHSFQRVYRTMKRYGRDARIPPAKISQDYRSFVSTVRALALAAYGAKFEHIRELAKNGSSFENEILRLKYLGQAANFNEEKIAGDILSFKGESSQPQHGSSDLLPYSGDPVDASWGLKIFQSPRGPLSHPFFINRDGL